ncbi:MAG: hypothetical protein A2X53_09820 [Candidatus Rokubacteria bacterium GWA2_70_23]|nr:MAG: hypothetical protein A2X53_09820 [Candidatus Rokubacteria bacterium GWA2_70_23]
MERRRLGRTGHMSTVVTFGAAGIGRVDQETADRAVETALAHGVNHVDVAPRYGEAVQIIKTVARDPWGDRPRTHTTWYEPFTDQAIIDQAVAFVLSRPVTTLCSVGDVTVLPRVLEAAERFRAIEAPAEAALLATSGRYHSPFVGDWA